MITKKKQRVERTRGNKTLTESQFWGGIRSALRQKSRWWKPIAIAKNKARRPYKGPRKRQKFEYQCNICKGWFPEKQIAVDHIIPCGTLSKADDLPRFVERLFCEVDGFQVLCNDCHSIKTLNEKTKNGE